MAVAVDVVVEAAEEVTALVEVVIKTVGMLVAMIAGKLSLVHPLHFFVSCPLFLRIRLRRRVGFIILAL